MQLLGISNAVVDILAHVDLAFLEKVGVPRGAMTLIDEARAHELYNMMGEATEMSGGSVANTVAGFAILGGTASYIGRVKDDPPRAPLRRLRGAPTGPSVPPAAPHSLPA